MRNHITRAMWRDLRRRAELDPYLRTKLLAVLYASMVYGVE